MAATRNDNVRKKILDATDELLQKNSMEKISLAMIAEKAGVSKGTLYYYYHSKEDLLFDIADRYLEQQYQELFDWTSDPSKDTSFPRLFKYVLQRDVHEPAARFQLLAAACSGNDSLRRQLLDRYAKFLKAISAKIAERVQGIDPDYLAWASLLLSDGIIIQCELKNESFDPEPFIRKTESVLKRFMSSRSDGRDNPVPDPAP